MEDKTQDIRKRQKLSHKYSKPQYLHSNFLLKPFKIIFKEKELSHIKEKFSIDNSKISALSEENAHLSNTLNEKNHLIDNLEKELGVLRSHCSMKEEENAEIRLALETKEKELIDLNEILKIKENELKGKKKKLSDFEKKSEILESENAKIQKVFQHKLHELEEFRIKMSHPFEVEELRTSLDHLKKTNSVFSYQNLKKIYSGIERRAHEAQN